MGNRVAIIQEYTSSWNWKHVLSQSNPANLISQGTELATLLSLALWWKGPQWQLQEPSTWPNLETSTSKDNLEVWNVHVAAVHVQEDVIHSPSYQTQPSSREIYDYQLWQWHQFPGCIKPMTWSIQHASVFPTKGSKFLGQWRMWLEVHSPIWTPLQRLMGSSCDIHETPLMPFIRNTNAIYEELCTLLSEKEACLNSRPLCAYLKAGLHLRGKFASPIESI